MTNKILSIRTFGDGLRAKGRISTDTYNKLKNKKYGPYRVLQKINGNDYIANPLKDMTISPCSMLRISSSTIHRHRDQPTTPRGWVLSKRETDATQNHQFGTTVRINQKGKKHQPKSLAPILPTKYLLRKAINTVSKFHSIINLSLLISDFPLSGDPLTFICDKASGQVIILSGQRQRGCIRVGKKSTWGQKLEENEVWSGGTHDTCWVASSGTMTASRVIDIYNPFLAEAMYHEVNNRFCFVLFF